MECSDRKSNFMEGFVCSHYFQGDYKYESYSASVRKESAGFPADSKLSFS